MRILYVTRQYPPGGVGGIGTYVEVLAQLMAEAGHDVTVVSAAPDQARATELVAGVRIERFPALGPGWLWRALHRRSWVVAVRLHVALSAWAAVRRLGQRFDVIEAPEWKAEGLFLPWCRRGPLVVHLHLPQELVRRWRREPLRRGRGEDVAERFERRTVRGASAVTATSRLSRTLPDGGAWLPGVPVEVVPPPLLVDAWDACAPIEATAPVVLFLGHLEPRKAPEVLVDALGRLAGEIDGLQLVVAGRSFAGPGGASYDEHLRRQAEALGVDLRLLGPQRGHAAMLDLYGAARVVAVPSRYETLSMVALEGFACGRPVVMTEAVGAREWVEDAVPELVVPADDPRALAEALRPLLLDTGAARRLGDLGRVAVATACSIEAIVQERTKVYGAAAAN